MFPGRVESKADVSVWAAGLPAFRAEEIVLDVRFHAPMIETQPVAESEKVHAPRMVTTLAIAVNVKIMAGGQQGADGVDGEGV